MNSFHDLSGRAAIITGGGIGIGRAISLKLAEAGANITVASRNEAHLEGVVKEVEGQGREIIAVPTDVRRPEQVDNMVDKTVERFGKVDILVNNAGASFRCPAEDISPNGWNTIVSINLNGTFLCSRAVAKRMIQQKEVKIINIASVAGRDGDPGMAHYGAAKAGVINLTKSLAIEWAKYGIRVNCIAPGPIETEGVKAVFEVKQDKPITEVALARWGQPHEIANTVLFLASESSSFITGETICVDGGMPFRER